MALYAYHSTSAPDTQDITHRPDDAMTNHPPAAHRFDPRRSLALDRAIGTIEAPHSTGNARYWARLTKALIEQFVPPFTKAVQP